MFNAYFDAMRRYFSFSGRSTRSQYWYFNLVVIIAGIIAMILDAHLGLTLDDPSDGPGALFSVVALVHVIPLFTVTVRRLHDANRTGWWAILNVIPIGALMIWAFACEPSTASANRFGPPVSPRAKRKAHRETPNTASPSPEVHLDQLEKLAALRASGVLDETEFQQLKGGILARAIK